MPLRNWSWLISDEIVKLWRSEYSERNEQADGDAEQAANEDLDGGVADEFAQALLSDGVALPGLVNHLIDDARLDADGATDTGGIIHDDACQHDGNGKGG